MAATHLSGSLCAACDLAEDMRQPINVLLVCRANPSFDGLRSLSVFEDLLPGQVRTIADRSEFNSKREVRRASMLDDNFRVGHKRCKDAFIEIVVPVRAVHHELPATACSELKDFEGIGKAFRPSPQCQQISRRKSVIYFFGRVWQGSGSVQCFIFSHNRDSEVRGFCAA